jgi:hypothetical protein
MIRFFYSICFLALGMGLPLLAKNAGVEQPMPSNNSKAGSKSLPAPSPALAAAKAKEQAVKKEVVLTKGVARGANTPAAVTADAAPVTVRPDAPAHVVAHDEHAPTFVIRNSTMLTYGTTPPPVRATLPAVTAIYESDHEARGSEALSPSERSIDRPCDVADDASGTGRLARVTAYWAAEGDYYTERCISATGVRLHDGHCAVDPSIIPYGSVVEIAGVGKFLAVDTGSAVINRTAAREGGKTSAERHAIVVDLFFEDREAGERFEAAAAKYVAISWWTPSSMGVEAKLARSLFAEEDWTKIQGKQL